MRCTLECRVAPLNRCLNHEGAWFDVILEDLEPHPVTKLLNCYGMLEEYYGHPAIRIPRDEGVLHVQEKRLEYRGAVPMSRASAHTLEQ